MQVETGSYTGDGNDDRQIAVSFQPDWVWVKNVTATRAPVVRHKDYGSNLSNFPGLFAGMLTNGIKALNGSGFTVGVGVYANESGETHHWLALRDNGDGDLKVGTYVGDGNVTQAITGVGFAPDFVHAQKDDIAIQRDSYWRQSTLTAPAKGGLYRPGNHGDSEYFIKSLDADGFTVGTLDFLNGSGVTYFYIACKHGSNFQSGTYVGDGADDRIISQMGTLLFVATKKRVIVTSNVPVMFRLDQSGVTDESFDCGDNAALADAIQEFTGGGFEIGQHDRVNTNSADYDWWAWGTGMSIPGGFGGGGPSIGV